MDLYCYEATVERIVDGDTLVLRIDVGFKIEYRNRCRLYGVNAPEIQQEGGQAATAWIVEHAPAGSRVLVRSHALDKYGRGLVEIWPKGAPAGQASLNVQMIQAGVAERA